MKSLSVQITVPKMITFADALVNLSKTAAWVSEDAVYSGYLEKITARLADLTTAYQSDKALSPLAEADSRRDDLLTRLCLYATGCASVMDDEKRGAAEKVCAVLAKYGRDTVRSDYATESARIKSLREDLAAADLAAAISLFPDMGALLAALGEAEDRFKALNAEYTQAKAAEKNRDSAYIIKKELLALINKQLLPYLAIMAEAKPGTYGELASQVETELARANASVNRTKSASSSGATSAAEA